jgi:hypothetical protein
MQKHLNLKDIHNLAICILNYFLILMHNGKQKLEIIFLLSIMSFWLSLTFLWFLCDISILSRSMLNKRVNVFEYLCNSLN